MNQDKYYSLSYDKETMLNGVRKSWKKFIKKEMNKEYFNEILDKIKKDQDNKKLIFPFPNNVFETLKYTKKRN